MDFSQGKQTLKEIYYLDDFICLDEVWYEKI